MRKLVSLWPALLSAVLYHLAFEPFNVTLMVFVALVPLLARLQKTTPKESLWLGYAFGFFFWLGQMDWLRGFVWNWTDSLGLALVPYVAACLLGAWYFALFGWLANRCWKADKAWLIPLLWVGIEVFRSYIPGLAFPWGLMALPLWRYPALIQSAYFGMIFLVSFWLMLPNVLLANWMAGEKLGRLRPLILVFAFVFGLSFIRYFNEENTVTKVVTVGQLGVDLAYGDRSVEDEKIKAAVEQLYLTSLMGGSDLLVLPEGIASGGDSFPPETPFIVEPNVPVLFGGQRGQGPVYQSAYAYDGQWSVADKTRLVIFGEYVPFRSSLPFLDNFSLPQGDLSQGDKVTPLTVGGLKVGPLLCFEALFPDIAYRQANQDVEVLAVLSIDDWYMGTNAPEQLMAGSVWRSVETGLPLVRAASMGYSLATDGKGRILAQAPLKETLGMRVELPVGKPQPFAPQPFFPLLCVGSLLYLLVLPWLPSRR
jgi:apolipoprotein N-acyltransferase